MDYSNYIAGTITLMEKNKKYKIKILKFYEQLGGIDLKYGIDPFIPLRDTKNFPLYKIPTGN